MMRRTEEDRTVAGEEGRVFGRPRARIWGVFGFGGGGLSEKRMLIGVVMRRVDGQEDEGRSSREGVCGNGGDVTRVRAQVSVSSFRFEVFPAGGVRAE